MRRLEFADEKFLYSQIWRLAAKRSAMLVQTEGVPVPHSKSVRTKLRDFIVNENPCHTLNKLFVQTGKRLVYGIALSEYQTPATGQVHAGRRAPTIVLTSFNGKLNMTVSLR